MKGEGMPPSVADRPEPRRHHYVLQFYLRLCDGKSLNDVLFGVSSADGMLPEVLTRQARAKTAPICGVWSLEKASLLPCNHAILPPVNVVCGNGSIHLRL